MFYPPSSVCKEMDYSEVISEADFINNHLIPNRPLLVGPKLTQNWRCRKEWIKESVGCCPTSKVCFCNLDKHSSSQLVLSSSVACQTSCFNRVKQAYTFDGNKHTTLVPNLAYLRKNFGSSAVSVSECDIRDFNSHLTKSSTLGEFVENWEKTISMGNKASRLYLKDWHFQLDYPDYQPYNVPDIFKEDWMDRFWKLKKSFHDAEKETEIIDLKTDDHCFVYLGSDGTWTPFHTDVINSYSWSTNLCGVKLWLFIPPSDRHLWMTKHGHSTCYNLLDKEDIIKNFPGLVDYQFYAVYQLPGETIFVPSGWGHQVFNIGDVLSVNQNWGNGYNSISTSNYLSDSLKEVQNTIEDCRETMLANFEFESHCQKILKCHVGINCIDWISWISWAFVYELSYLKSISYQHSVDIPPKFLLLCDDFSLLLPNLKKDQDFLNTLTFPRYLTSYKPDAQLAHCCHNLMSLISSFRICCGTDSKTVDYLTSQTRVSPATSLLDKMQNFESLIRLNLIDKSR